MDVKSANAGAAGDRPSSEAAPLASRGRRRFRSGLQNALFLFALSIHLFQRKSFS